MTNALIHSIREYLELWGFSGAADGKYDGWIYVIMATAATFAVVFLLRFVIVRLLQKITARRSTSFFREILDTHLFERMLWLLPPSVLSMLLPFALKSTEKVADYLGRICSIAIVCIIVWSVNTLVTVCWHIFSNKGGMRNRPMKGLIQIIHGIFIGIGAIISVSVLINRSPTVLITGLGAFAAVLMLIFKDSILGFVSGVQLSQYDMIRNGDWIVIPGTTVNGVVLDVTLNTVKVRNFDNTILTLPPYTLISQPVQNWRGMSESGGRRIMRSYTIDIDSVRFCDDKMLELFSKIELLHDYIEKKQQQKTNGQSFNTDNPDGLPNGTIDTNLGVFRAYLTLYLRQNKDVRNDFTMMVRTLEPTENGIPLQVYCFTATTHWESYESIQSEIFEHIAAIMPTFGLYVYQEPSGRNYIAQSLLEAGYKPAEIVGLPQVMVQNSGDENSNKA